MKDEIIPENRLKTYMMAPFSSINSNTPESAFHFRKFASLTFSMMKNDRNEAPTCDRKRVYEATFCL